MGITLNEFFSENKQRWHYFKYSSGIPLGPRNVRLHSPRGVVGTQFLLVDHGSTATAGLTFELRATTVDGVHCARDEERVAFAKRANRWIRRQTSDGVLPLRSHQAGYSTESADNRSGQLLGTTEPVRPRSKPADGIAPDYPP